jgi:hypothetical protein
MYRARNIVKILILTVVILLSGMTRYASAQNTSATPFIDSWHLYQVGMGNVGNTVTWQLMQDNYTTPTTTLSLTDALAWVDTTLIDGPLLDETTIEIKFVDAFFNDGDVWYLVYSEWNGTNCIARRYTRIDITDNSFYLSLPVDDTICNSYSGTTWANTIAVISDDEYVSNVTFTVNMTKDATFLIDKWRFSGSITFPSGATHLEAATPFPVTVGVPASLGTWLITPAGGGNFILEVTTPADFAGTSDAVTFTVRVEGDVTQDFKIQLALTNGQAESGNLYIAETDDNQSLGGDRVVVRTIIGVPNTSLITMSP